MGSEERIDQSRQLTTTEEQVGSNTSTDSTSCTSCGKPVGSEKFCSNCGTPIGLAKCPSCSNDLAPGMKFCGNCGNPVAAG
jgi:membrane protease subunit (stomatin/prohibitin family)